jgi:hypothetical protein
MCRSSLHEPRGLPIMDAMLSVIADSDGFGWRFGHVA